jgi:hypothetical protein
LEAMCECVGQAQAGDELPPSGVVSQRAVSPATESSSVDGATAGRALLLPVLDGGRSRTTGTNLNGGRMPCVRRLIASMATTAVPCWPVMGCSCGAMLRLFTSVSGATRLTGHQKPAVRLHCLEALRGLLTRVASALDIKLVDIYDSPFVSISAEFCEALQESWASARGCFLTHNRDWTRELCCRVQSHSASGSTQAWTP